MNDGQNVQNSHNSGLGACGKCVRCSFLILNCFTFFGGILSLALAVYVWRARSMASVFFHNMFFISVVIVAVIGGVLAILSIMGCIAAYQESRTMLLVFYILMFIVFLLLLAGGILHFITREKILNKLESNMKKSLNLYGQNQDYKKGWEETQYKIHCCGVHKADDWKIVPLSCCKYDENIPTQCSDRSKMHKEGCYEKIVSFISANVYYVGVIVIVVAATVLLDLALACALFLMK